MREAHYLRGVGHLLYQVASVEETISFTSSARSLKKLQELVAARSPYEVLQDPKPPSAYWVADIELYTSFQSPHA